jgi:hypothetical protein
MSRIDRRPFFIEISKKPGAFDLLDNLHQGLFRLDEKETNLLLNNLTDEDITFLLGDFQSFSAKKKLIVWLRDKEAKLIS